MPRYVLLLGSNLDASAALARATALIDRSYGVLCVGDVLPSPDREAAAATNARSIYLNGALEIASALCVEALKAELRMIEAQCGRIRPAPPSGLCAMDIDIALIHLLGAWQIVDQKAVAPDYAQLALAPWFAGLASPHIAQSRNTILQRRVCRK
jgi:7,8-dihydro-6-hydroxymethylpterin-pyrophosphokinase